MYPGNPCTTVVITDMPPKTRKASSRASNRGKEKDKSPFICPVCDEQIIDGTDEDPGQESIECEGKCLTWLCQKSL